MAFFARSTPMVGGYNFTERTRHVLARARDEASQLGHEYVGTEHILLGLLAEEDCVASAALEALGVDRPRAAALILDTVKKGTAARPTGPDLPYTSRAKKVLELVMAEARELDHRYVGVEHLLLGLVREEKGIAAQVLMDSGVLIAPLRAEVVRILGPMPSHGERSPTPQNELAFPGRAPTPLSAAMARSQEERAWQRLTQALDVCAKLGATPTLTLADDGALTVSLGADLVITVDFPPDVRLRRRVPDAPPAD